jgi:molecular chaperone DnaK (HSP70)
MQLGIRVLQSELEMSMGSKLLGEFVLIGILPAPRAMPQFEVAAAA